MCIGSNSVVFPLEALHTWYAGMTPFLSPGLRLGPRQTHTSFRFSSTCSLLHRTVECKTFMCSIVAGVRSTLILVSFRHSEAETLTCILLHATTCNGYSRYCIFMQHPDAQKHPGSPDLPRELLTCCEFLLLSPDWSLGQLGS